MNSRLIILLDINQNPNSSNISYGCTSEYHLFAPLQQLSDTTCPLERRYATYKAFYYPQTPASYEPPYFRPGDSESDRYFFSTHGKDEVPERWSIGKLETGWHG
jgi:hypothetical protein